MSEKRSSGRAKKVDYAALQEIKIEEVDCDDDFDDTTEKVVIVPSSPPKKKRKTTQQSAKGKTFFDEKLVISRSGRACQYFPLVSKEGNG